MADSIRWRCARLCAAHSPPDEPALNFRNAGGHPVISLRAPYDPLIVEDLCALPGEEQEAAIGRLAENTRASRLI